MKMAVITHKNCSKCGRYLPAGMFNKAKWLATGLRPDCKDCYAAAKKAYWAAKPKSEMAKRKAENAALAKVGKRRCKGCGEVKSACEDDYAKVSCGAFNSTCRVCDRAKVKKWAAENSERAKASAAEGWARRYARKKRRTIPLTELHKAQIKEIYAECRRRNKGAPRSWHVDHIMPLSGRDSCGLHVPWNLQLLPMEANTRKSNKIPIGNCSLDAATAGARSILSLILSGRT